MADKTKMESPTSPTEANENQLAELGRAESSASDRDVAALKERTPWKLVISLALACALSLNWLLPGFYDPSISTGDGAVYLVTARSLLEGEGYNYLGEPFTIRPPGFSWMLVPLLWIFGTNYVALTWCIALFGVLAVCLLFLYARPRLGTPLALAVALTLWLNPGFLRSCSQIMSDVPGLALMFGALLMERWARKRPSTGTDLRANLLLGVFIGISAYVRTLNIFLVPALILGRICATWRTGLNGRTLGSFVGIQLLLPSVIAFGCLVPWNSYAAGVDKSVPPEHTLFYSYSVAMWQQDIADPESPKISFDEFSDRVVTRVGDLLHVLGSRVTDRDDNQTHRALAIIALLIWAAVLVVRRGTGDFLLGGIVLIISIYFGFMNRLIVPVYALILISVAEALRYLFTRCAGAKKSSWITVALVLSLAVIDFDPSWRWDQARSRSQQFFKACQAANRRFDAEDTIAADFGAHFSVELDRPVYTLRWSLKRGGVPAALDFIKRHSVSSLILDRSVPSNVKLLNHLENEQRTIVAQIGPYALLNLE